MRFIKFLEKQNSIFWFSISTVCLLIIGTCDYLVGSEIVLDLFYLVPIAITSWFASRAIGLYTTISSSLIVSYFAECISEEIYLKQPIALWKITSRICFFIITNTLLVNLQNNQSNLKQLANTDFLTKAVNSRRFYEIVSAEIYRCQRYKRAFTIAYIDFDNFKWVNDNLGHQMGNIALQTVASTIQQVIRKVDVLARLGGDEFALLLPETSSKPAKTVITKIQAHILNAMEVDNLPITFSIGVVTCYTPPDSIDELIQQADALMYEVKKNGKGGIRFDTYANRTLCR